VKPLSEAPESFGMKLGFKLSLILATTYSFIGVFIVENLTQHDTSNFLFVLVLGSSVILLLAILPAVFYGVLTGMFLAVIISKYKRLLSSITSVLLGMALCAVITVLTHFLFNIPVTLSFVYPSTSYGLGIYETYPFYIGIPSIIYILSGGWASWYIYKNFGNGYKS
jgi:hypothetical protein